MIAHSRIYIAIGRLEWYQANNAVAMIGAGPPAMIEAN